VRDHLQYVKFLSDCKDEKVCSWQNCRYSKHKKHLLTEREGSITWLRQIPRPLQSLESIDASQNEMLIILGTLRKEQWEIYKII